MNRSFLLASGVVLWMVAAADVLVHLLDGDVLAPAVMAAVFVLYVGIRQAQTRQVRVAAPIADPA